MDSIRGYYLSWPRAAQCRPGESPPRAERAGLTEGAADGPPVSVARLDDFPNFGGKFGRRRLNK